ncbi:MAG: SpoIIE family protein phosphatase [Acidobacteria bacterium]|nr:SpoIIE family protein phosphatase [Acidobacteriota bacterium]MBV9475189.1 SpoIIE family protein phosphatase [Acidobacteriota bacterium]
MERLPGAQPPEPKRRGVSPAFVVWLIGIGAIVLINYIQSLAERFHRSVPNLGVLEFFAWLLVCCLTLYGLALFTRWFLRKLFWTVGRRLFLSYVMIGVLPFFLFAVLLAAILYVIAGVASQQAFKAERQSSLGQLEALNADYALQGKRPRLDGIEIYDTADGSAKKLPEWLHETTYSGFALRAGVPLLVSSRQYPNGRTVVLALPMNEQWERALEERGGMVVSTRLASQEGQGFNISEGDFGDFTRRGVGWRRIFFYDITERGGLIDWESGEANPEKRLFTAISNPTSNLVQFYFGGATNSKIMRAIFGIILGLATTLMLAYLIATAFAAVLIFSISRAVNRIEKGTRAVERGDFSYRIRMKRHNQLGAMAQSFDRMTESIASLLASVTEKERLQSEIEIAASIQRNLLPKEGPQFRGVSFSAHFEPTASIGGDYYDVFNIDKTRLAVAIGDVSGHGLSTGLVMAMVKAAITTLVEEGADEASLFQRLNELVFRSTERRAFMTLAFTIFDLERGTIRHTNAGHLYPYLVRRGVDTPISIESPSLPLGVRSTMAAQTAEVDLKEGDAIVYLSDGIVEAQDENGDPLGFEQLERLLAANSDRSPSDLRDAILDAVARHSGTRAADDDRTVMVIRFDNLKSAAPDASALAVNGAALVT